MSYIKLFFSHIYIIHMYVKIFKFIIKNKNKMILGFDYIMLDLGF